MDDVGHAGPMSYHRALVGEHHHDVDVQIRIAVAAGLATK